MPASSEPELPSPDAHKTAVETRLRNLRNSYRLGLHMWEEYRSPGFPDFSWNTISAIPNDRIDAMLSTGHFPLLSLSLLPSDASGLSMRLYGLYDNPTTDAAYLLDLSQEQPHAPRIARITEFEHLNSGSIPTEKKLYLSCPNTIAGMDAFYHQFEGQDDEARKIALLKALGNGKGRDYSNLQLDVLGQFYENPASRLRLEDPGIVLYNEVIAACAREHITALAVPFYTFDTPPEYEPLRKLFAALCGIRHLQKGIDVPVVFYHVTGVDQTIQPGCRNGDCSYLAQGRDELHALALDALITLKDIRFNPHLHSAYRHTILEMSGIDLSRPLADQKKALECFLENSAPAHKMPDRATETAKSQQSPSLGR